MKKEELGLSSRPTYVEIDMQKAQKNFYEIQKIVPTQKIMCVVKGNAYGHGLVPMARLYQELGADYLGVAIPEEGIALRKANIHIPILVLSTVADNQISLCLKYELSITIPSVNKLITVNRIASECNMKARVHINVDTGMNRIGVHWEAIDAMVSVMKSSRNCFFEGLYSHFAMSDEISDFTNVQIQRFNKVLSFFREHGFDFNYIHLANSGAVLFHPTSHMNMVRLGIILYGLFEGRDIPKNLNIQPILTWKTQVVFLKKVKQGEGVGYGHSYVTKSSTNIATLAVGYADGYERCLYKEGKVEIGNKIYPIAGKVCMDQMMVDVGEDTLVQEGDMVTIIGSPKNATTSFYNLSRWSAVSIYELMCQISERVPRRYIYSPKK